MPVTSRASHRAPGGARDRVRLILVALLVAACGGSGAGASATLLTPTPSSGERASPTVGGSIAGAASLPGDSASGTPSASTPSPDHVVVIVLENQSAGSLVGYAPAQWINNAIQTYGYASNYTSLAHPSQPNYIGLTSGSTNGVTGDGNVTVDAKNIVDQLEAKGLSWKAYFQSLPTGGNSNKLEGSARALYARKHDPFVSYADIASNDARLNNIVNLPQLQSDLASGSLPNFVWITPDQCHDMHGIAPVIGGPCGFIQMRRDLVTAADQFLATWIPQILAYPGWTDHSVIFITWDEADGGDTSACCGVTNGGGHVLTLVVTKGGHKTSATPYNHYSLLATVQEILGLPCLGATCDTTNVKPMNDLLNGSG